MATEGPAPRLLIAVLSLSTVSAAATLVHLLIAPTPLPPLLPAKPMESAIRGYRLEPLAAEPAAAGRRLAHRGLQRFTVRPLVGGESLELSLVTLHSRSHSTFQLAALTSGADAPVGLALQERSLLAARPPVALGRIHSGAHRPSRAALQTCLVASTATTHGEAQVLGGVSQKQLTGLLHRRTRGGPGWPGLWRDLAQLLGLQPNVRWQCLLVSVSTTAPPPAAETALWRFWGTAAPVLARLAP